MLANTSSLRTKVEAMLETKIFDLNNLTSLVILIKFNWFISIKLSVCVIVLTIEEI